MTANTETGEPRPILEFFSVLFCAGLVLVAFVAGGTYLNAASIG